MGFDELDWEESANLITKCVDCWVSWRVSSWAAIVLMEI